MASHHFDCDWLCVPDLCLVRLWLDDNGNAHDDADDDGVGEFPRVFLGDSHCLHFLSSRDFCLLVDATKQKIPSSL